jgi:Calpain large subunit, domain III
LSKSPFSLNKKQKKEIDHQIPKNVQGKPQLSSGKQRFGCTLYPFQPVVPYKPNSNRTERNILFLFFEFCCFQLKDPKSSATPLPREYFLYNSSVAKSPVFMNTREVVTRFRMPPGTYVIIPSTFDPNQEGAFLLRVYTEVESTMQ